MITKIDWPLLGKFYTFSEILSGTQRAITCSKLTIETLEKRCEIWSKLKIKTAGKYWLGKSFPKK